MAIVFVERVASKEQVEIHGSRGDRELATEIHEKKVKQDCSDVWPQRGSLHVTGTTHCSEEKTSLFSPLLLVVECDAFATGRSLELQLGTGVDQVERRHAVDSLNGLLREQRSTVRGTFSQAQVDFETKGRAHQSSQRNCGQRDPLQARLVGPATLIEWRRR